MDLLKHICCNRLRYRHRLKLRLSFGDFSKIGFSLIELLVVGALIGILSSLAITAVQSMMYKSRQAEASLNLRIIRTQQYVYAAQFRKFYDVDQDDNTKALNAIYGLGNLNNTSFCPINGLGFIRDGDYYRYSTDAFDAFPPPANDGGKLEFAAQARVERTSSLGRFVLNNINQRDIWLNNTAGEVCALVDTIKQRIDLCTGAGAESWAGGTYNAFKNGVLPDIANRLGAPANCQRR